MDQLTGFTLAVLPILIIFIGLVFLKKSGTLMGVIGWIATLVIAIIFFNTSPEIAAYASINGFLSSLGISLMVLFTILQVTMMDLTGAIKRITEFIKSIAAERYEQIMILNIGLGSFLVSIGATPVTMLPPIMLALGFSPLAAVALPCLGYDPLTSFSLLAIPITLPAQVFGMDVGSLSKNIAIFLPLVSTGFAMGMLWIADGIEGVKKGFVPALIAGGTLGLSCIAFVNLLPVSAIGLVGVFSGLTTIAVLFLIRVIQGKPIFYKTKVAPRANVLADGPAPMPLWKAAFPWILLVMFCIVICIPDISAFLHGLLGDSQKIHIVANKYVDLKILNQAYFWVLISTVLSAPFLIRSKEEANKIVRLWLKRAWSPTLAAAVFFAIAYVMDWSAQSVVDGILTFAPGAADFNMNAVIGLTFALFFGAAAFPAISPLLGLFGSFVSGSETSSNVMFYGILKKSTDVLDLDFMNVYSAHAVSGGIASAIAPAKIINAAAVIDKLGIEGEVIQKSAVIAILLTIVTGAVLLILLAL
ncbi:L-lactate permease [Methanocella sp. CWC-04]|uniref:L-lactate permease n=1 Tax=Methanooceanicella nereidis TaxID=2052831 RepID=A0AAP2W505_9EURY|nr:L-lactate permease [Methanocella sp. CWC-04]MCD1294960.1 L-lactate permease [Methanocella sp. CWC-04]